VVFSLEVECYADKGMKCSIRSALRWSMPWALDEEDVTAGGHIGRRSRGRVHRRFLGHRSSVWKKPSNIKIPRGRVVFRKTFSPIRNYVKDGKVTETGLPNSANACLSLIRRFLEKNPAVQDFGNLLKVSDMCRFVEGKVGSHRLNALVLDRSIDEFESGRYAKAIKCISLPRSTCTTFFPLPLIPNSLVTRAWPRPATAYLGHNHFRRKSGPRQIPKGPLLYATRIPGDTSLVHHHYRIHKEEGAMVSATSHKGDILHAEAEIVFAHLNDSDDYGQPVSTGKPSSA